MPRLPTLFTFSKGTPYGDQVLTNITIPDNILNPKCPFTDASKLSNQNIDKPETNTSSHARIHSLCIAGYTTLNFARKSEFAICCIRACDNCSVEAHIFCATASDISFICVLICCARDIRILTISLVFISFIQLLICASLHFIPDASRTLINCFNTVARTSNVPELQSFIASYFSLYLFAINSYASSIPVSILFANCCSFTFNNISSTNPISKSSSYVPCALTKGVPSYCCVSFPSTNSATSLYLSINGLRFSGIIDFSVSLNSFIRSNGSLYVTGLSICSIEVLGESSNKFLIRLFVIIFLYVSIYSIISSIVLELFIIFIAILYGTFLRISFSLTLYLLLVII